MSLVVRRRSFVKPKTYSDVSLGVGHDGWPTADDRIYFAPVLPTFFFKRSPAYRTPLFLYGSGGRRLRISAATCPTFWRSIPVTLSLVCFGSTVASTPTGNGYSIKCENPRLNTTVFLPFISARYPMPTISRSRVHPLVTPSTALLTRARAKPWTAAWESFSRIASRCPSCCWTLMPAGSWVSSLPFGPCTATVLPSILTVTPFGSGIGFFPIRDIDKLSAFSSRLSATSFWLLATSL